MANPVQVLTNILNVVSRTEKHVSEINERGKNSSNDAAIPSAAAGATGGGIKNENIGKKLDVIIDLLEKITGTDKGTADASALKNVSEGLGALTAGAIKLSLIPKKARDGIVSFIDSLLSTLEKHDGEKTKKNAEALIPIGKTLNKFVLNIALFGTVLVAFSLVVPQILRGVSGFAVALGGLIVSLIAVNKVLKTDKSGKITDTSPLHGLISLGAAVAIFGVTMAAFSLATPLILKGSQGFMVAVAGLALTIVAVGLAIQAGGKGLRDTSPLHALKSLAVSIALFGLTMVAFSFATPLIVRGATGFMVVVAGLALTIVAVGLALQAGGKGLRDTSPLHTLKSMVFTVALAALVMVGISYVLPQVALGALGFTAAAAAIALSIFMIHKAIGNKEKLERPTKTKAGGTGALSTITKMAWAVGFFMIVMVGVGFFWQQAAKGSLVAIASISALGLVSMTILGNANVKRGAENLKQLSFSLAIFAGSMAVWTLLVQPKLTWEGIGMLAAVIVAVSGIATVLGIPKITNWVKNGTKNLILIGASLAIFAGGLAIYAQLAAPKLTWQNIAMLGAVIVTTSLIATVLGIPPIAGFALLGSVALIAIGGALVVFSFGLSIFAKSNFQEKDGDSLNYALRKVMGGFLGKDDPNNLSLKDIVKIPIMIGYLGLSSIAMLGVSLSLLPITKALSIFKKVNWTDKDSDVLNLALTSVTKGFADALKNVNWKDLFFGINAMKNIGTSLTGVAEGIQAFANLTFNEYEYDKATGKMKLISKVKLTPADITQTGISIGTVISAITKPLAEFGEMIQGKEGAGFLGVNWGRMAAMKMGITSLGTIGSGLVNLAQGVQDWANMTITEWGIQTDKETGLNVLVPMKKRPIRKDEIDKAIANISDMLSVLGSPLSTFGSFFAEEKTSFFGFTYKVENKGLKLGIQSLGNIGSGLVGIVEGIQRWAAMEYTPMTIGIDKQTGLNVLMPDKPKPITRGMIKLAIANISDVLTGLAFPLSQFGKLFSVQKETWYGSAYPISNEGLLTGIEQMGNIANNLSTMAGMIAAWARFEYTEMEVHRDANGKTILQPKKIATLGKKGIEQAVSNIKYMLSAVGEGIQSFSKGQLASSTTLIIFDELFKIAVPLAKWTIFINKYFGDDKSLKAGNNFKKFLQEMGDPVVDKMGQSYNKLANAIDRFGPSFTRFATPLRILMFNRFTNDIIRLARIATPFEKFAASFGLMAKGMDDFTKSFMKLSPTSIKTYTDFTSGLIKFSTMNTSAFKAKMDLVAKTFGIDADGKTVADKASEGSAGQVITRTGQSDKENKDQAKNVKGLSQDTIKIIEKLNSLEMAINAITRTIDDGVSVSGNVKVSNLRNGTSEF